MYYTNWLVCKNTKLIILKLTQAPIDSVSSRSWFHRYPYCDNQTVVNVWEKGTCKSPEIMALVHMIYFCAAHNNFNVCVQHIPGVRNDIADALSRFQHHRFRRMAPKAKPHPDIIPAWPQQAFIAASCNVDIMVSHSQLSARTNPG